MGGGIIGSGHSVIGDKGVIDVKNKPRVVFLCWDGRERVGFPIFGK